ncbi:MAG TPA: hypothetical protein VG710_01275 [Opitutus sp.]|nr:hypothetical protein [Opitutus sp.]
MSDSDPHSSSPPNRRQIIAGFLTAAGIFGLLFLVPPGPRFDNVLPYLIAITLLPLAALVLSIIKSTRRFGLGMCLGCGAVWLVMLAICGGMLRNGL